MQPVNLEDEGAKHERADLIAFYWFNKVYAVFFDTLIDMVAGILLTPFIIALNPLNICNFVKDFCNFCSLTLESRNRVKSKGHSTYETFFGIFFLHFVEAMRTVGYYVLVLVLCITVFGANSLRTKMNAWREKTDQEEQS